MFAKDQDIPTDESAALNGEENPMEDPRIIEYLYLYGDYIFGSDDET